VIGPLLAMLLVTGAVYTQIGKTFMPEMDEGDIIVGIEKLPSVSLEQTAALGSENSTGDHGASAGSEKHRGARRFR